MQFQTNRHRLSKATEKKKKKQSPRQFPLSALKKPLQLNSALTDYLRYFGIGNITSQSVRSHRNA